MSAKKHLDVMVSSTSFDLPQHREFARDAILSAGLFPLRMEEHSAEPQSNAVKFSLKMVQDCKIYVLILGLRYGYVPTAANPKNISVTQMEYEEAQRLERPVLAYIMRKEHDPDPIQDADLTAINAFRTEVQTNEICGFFGDARELREKLLQSLFEMRLALEGQGVYIPPEPPPATELAPHGALPPGSRVNFPRNDLFTGRDADLRQLAQHLIYKVDGASAVNIISATVGMGGLGKTQLAVEFCHRYGRFFHGVHWVQAPADATHLTPAEIQTALRAEIAECGQAMQIAGFPADNQPQQVALTLQAWQRGTHLVVLDNLENQQVLREILPQLNQTRILMTARRRNWDKALGLQLHRLDVLSEAEARELLRNLADQLAATPDSELDALAEKVGHLPLALDLIGRYLADTGLTPVKYRERLAQTANILDHAALVDWVEDSPTDHDVNVAASFELSWAQLGDTPHEALAQRIFRTTGYCAANAPIPDELLWRAVKEEDADPTEPAPLYFKALRRLLELGLLRRDENELVVHPLLNALARRLDNQAEARVLEAVADGLTRMATSANQTGLPANYAPLRIHVEYLAPLAEKAENEDAGRLWNSWGYHLYMIADYAGAQATYERALAFDERAFGADHPEVAVDVNNLGSVLESMGDYAGAKAAFERALAIFSQHLGADHPNVATLHNNLGEVLRQMGDYAGAQAAYERALAIDERAFGADHPNVAIRVNNLGMVMQAQGNYAGAQVAYEQALAIDERAFGADHPNVAIRVNNLGSVLSAQGDYAGAKTAYERALAIDERAFGADHPDVAIDVNNLGSVLQAQGNYSGARKHFERALKIRIATFGEKHPAVAQSYWWIGTILKQAGKRDEAKENIQRAVNIYEQLLPPEHPTLQNVRGWLADLE